MPNPRGTPENLQPISSDREEKLKETFTVRVTEEMKKEIKSKDDAQEFVREAIKEKLDREKQS